ncbi:hypothetical protein diail_6638 [Diaporthe ilicicola]|nr:hypothetical protein diail_6638 [Diaporthe ilicicola]
MSDLHLEVGQQYLTFNFDVTAPNLVLAGDIGRLVDYDGYVSFWQKQTARYNRMFLVLGNHEFYGTPFIPEDSARAVAAVVNDFKKIEGWSIEKHNANHAEDLTWLRDEVQNHNAHNKTLVVTHYAPLINKTASPQHKGNSIKSAFATDLLLDMTDSLWSLVRYWVFGHTHWTTQFRVKDTQVVSNQRGYQDVFPGNNVRLTEES